VFVLAEILFRFVIGGLVVAMFSAIGELFDPKRFSGIFGAAPSVAIATLGLTFWNQGGPTVAAEASWMVLGAVAMFTYAAASAALAKRHHFSIWLAAGGAWIAWFAVAMLGWFALRQELLA
jgi:hypothetical protein